MDSLPTPEVQLPILKKKIFHLPTGFLPPIIDNILGMPVIFTLIVLFQGCFGGLGIIQTPEKLRRFLNTPWMRILFIVAIGYTATSDIETTIFSTGIFFMFLHLLRTSEEKNKLEYNV